MHALRVTSVLTAALLAGGAVAPTAQSTLSLDAATIADLNAAFDAGTLTAESLTRWSLARIDAYDRTGPQLRGMIAVNPKALQTARALDVERRRQGRRSPLHGIPVVVKDNFDTAALPTTAGSLMLEGSTPPDDAFLVAKLTAAGAVLLGKANMSEFASGGAALSSLGGLMRNPHALDRTPSTSSGGSGIAVAAAYAAIGMGSDTGGSVRNPAAATGVVGLKPTHGLLGRDGIAPLALTYDTPGPLARHVADVAVALGVLVGVDPADPATARSVGHFATDYTPFLSRDALQGARLGVARDFLGVDAEVDWVVESALAAIVRAGATVIDVRFPAWLLDAKGAFYDAIRYPEFAAQIPGYLSTLGPAFPKTLGQLIERAMSIAGTRADGAGPNPVRWNLMRREAASGTLDAPGYLAVRDHGLPLTRAVVDGVIASHRLDAIVYPTLSRRQTLLAAPPTTVGGGRDSGVNLANLTGYPDLTVPAGFTADRLPVGLSFLGPPWSEGRLLGLGFSFEQATQARRLPVHTPRLDGEPVVVR
jgi:amidase